MGSGNDTIFPHKDIPKPPISESGASLDSGVGPSIGSSNSDLSPRKNVSKPPISESGAFPYSGIGHSTVWTGLKAWDPTHASFYDYFDLRYHVPVNQIPQSLSLSGDILTTEVLSEIGSTTHPGAQHNLNHVLLPRQVCTQCSHNMSDCGTCHNRSEFGLRCHICDNPPAHDMRDCVARITTTYTKGVSMFTTIRKKYHECQSTRELGQSLERGITEIKSRFDQFYQAAGQEYEEGDPIARERTKDITIALERGLLRYLRGAQEHGTTLDLTALYKESEQGRIHTHAILEDLYHRLSRPILPSFSMSINPTEPNHSGMEAANDVLFQGVDMAQEKSSPSGRIEQQDPIMHQPSRLPLPQSPNSSAALLNTTNITTPEYQEDSIDVGIPDIKNMDHILDATRYFSELDQLELQTAQMMGMENGPYTKLESLHDCIECLSNWQAALRYLQSQGFCGPSISILIEDQDRDGVASAVNISLSQVSALSQTISLPSNEDASKRLIENWIQTLLKVEEKSLLDLDLEQILRFLCEILAIGIISFSGSHVCPFDINLWDREVRYISVGFEGYSFKPQKLACLDDFIGGPAWILGKGSVPSQGMKISFTVQDLQELWGPISLVRATANSAPIIQTERGFIVPLPRERQSSLSISSSYDEVECHWMTEIPEFLSNKSFEVPILIGNTLRMLIGTMTDVGAGLVVNEKCKSSISIIGQQIASRLQYPGTSKSQYVSDGYDIQLVGGQYVTAGLMKKYKRIPKRTLKAMLIANCTKPDTRLVPLLNLRVGLEVSACTGNAQRVTLWDALRFSQTSTHSTDSPIYCAHNVGDKNCIISCWSRWQSVDEIDSLGHFPGQIKLLTGLEARRVIINSILALEHSGVDGEGNLQVSWPFYDSPLNCPVLPSTRKESHNWFRVIKDTRDSSSFAVFSQRCLEFPEKGIMRSCSAPCREEHSKPLKTTLLTRILTPTEEGTVSGLLVGAKFLVGEAHLTVTKAIKDQLAIIATVSMNPLNPLRDRLREILPDARAFDFKEHIWPDVTSGRSVPVFVY